MAKTKILGGVFFTQAAKTIFTRGPITVCETTFGPNGKPWAAHLEGEGFLKEHFSTADEAAMAALKTEEKP